jgi:hypothetical protein
MTRKNRFLNKFHKTISCILLALLSGCATYKYGEIAHSLLDQERIELTKKSDEEYLNYFNYEKDFVIKSEFEEITKTHIKKRIEFISSYGKTIAHYYVPHKDMRTNENRKFPAVEIFPIFYDEKRIVSKLVASYLIKREFACLSFEGKRDLLKGDLDEVKAEFRQMVTDGRRGLDWLIKQQEIDRDNLGVTGVSMGALVATLVAGVDERVKGGVLILGGGDLGKILSQSKENSIERYRKGVMQREQICLEQFAEYVSAYTEEIDPLTLAHRLNPRNFLMIDAAFDRVMPPSTSERLWQDMGKPDRIVLPVGHYSMIIFYEYIGNRMVDKFCDIFNVKNGRSPTPN